MIPIEQAQAAGFDFVDQLAVAEGHHEYSVRWTDPARPAPTLLVVEVRATGRAQLTTWIDELPDPALSRLPLCAPASDSALPEVEVHIATADRAVAGSFTGNLFARFGPAVAPRAWKWTVDGDGSSLRGELEFPADPPDPHRLDAHITVLHYIDGASDDRASLGLSMLQGVPPFTKVIQGYGAGPLDGCSSLWVPIEPAPAGCEEPRTQWFNCCMLAVDFWRADTPDEDAGALP